MNPTYYVYDTYICNSAITNMATVGTVEVISDKLKEPFCRFFFFKLDIAYQKEDNTNVLMMMNYR
jgi:hypothetical protein